MFARLHIGSKWGYLGHQLVLEKEMKKTRTVLAAAIFGALSASASAQTLFSFESGVGDWSSGNTAAMIIASSTTGATDGTQSMAITHLAGGGFSWIGNANAFSVASYLNGKSELIFDLTIGPNGLGGATWFNMDMAFNDAAGWRQTPAPAFDLPRDPGTHEVHVPIPASLQPVNPTNWFQIFLGFNGPAGAERTFYIDNIRVVPEPATIAALGLGAAALLRRRRR